MRICVDIDGVLYPWDRVAREFLEDRFGHALPPSSYWHAIKDAVPRAHWAALWTREGQNVVFGQLDRHYEGAVAMVNDLLAHGHDIHFVTHRDPKHTLAHTAAFLIRHFGRSPAWAGVHSVKRSTEKRSLGPWDVVIDDKPETVLDIAGRGAAMCFAPRRTWNQEDLEGADPTYLALYEDPWDVARWVEARS